MKVYALAGIAFILACGSADTRSNLEPSVDGQSAVEAGLVDAALGNDAQASDLGSNLMVDVGTRDDAGVGDGGRFPNFNPYQPRRSNTSCRLPEPPPIGGYAFERAFPQLDFNRPLWVGVAPQDNETMFVVEQGGRILAFDNDSNTSETSIFLDLNVNRSGNEEGLLGLAFHPDYHQNGRFYVHYSASGRRCDGSQRCSVISEFRASSPRQARADSERRLLVVPQPYSNHNGGALEFGPDGFLYISLGDGGAAGDPLGHGQNRNSLLGAILRIDVVPAAGQPYRIPQSNPFIAGGGRPEIWAWGLRNVWRMSFDRRTGALWAADVGQNRFEEIHRIDGPGNMGWKIREGFDCYRADRCQSDDLVEPVHAYPHSEGQSITGGLVYRGQRFPELWGHYLFGDYESGRVWSLVPSHSAPIASTLLGQQNRITHFGEDLDGALYIASFTGGIVRMVRRDEHMGDPFPQRLSETGCFSDIGSHTVAAGVVPYRVNVPFWSDGLTKDRYLAIPDGTKVIYRAEDAFEMPVGTVLIKTFNQPGHNGRAEKRIETRLWTRFQQGWRGFTYRWQEDQSDAVLITRAQNVPIEIAETESSWPLLSPMDCERCHTEAAGYTLGWAARQLTGVFTYPGGDASQLDALVEAGYLDMPPAADPIGHPRPDDERADAASHARARLHVDCASCHRPGGFANARLDLRVTTPLAATGLCATAQNGHLGTTAGLLVSPGDAEDSVVYQRISRRGEEGMPPIGTNRINDYGNSVIRTWIESLPDCSTPNVD